MKMQELLHNGYYKGHGFKYQSIISPCGIIEDLWGPLTGEINKYIAANK
jgi:hypothetical protein